MSAVSWYRYLMVFILVFSGFILIQGCIADTQGSADTSLISPPVTPPVQLEEETVKATIAPIHTKEPEVKPPVDNPLKPGQTPTGQVPTLVSSPRPTGTPRITPTPTVTLTSIVTGNNESAETYFQWGRAYADVGNCEAALIEFEKAIAREPYYADAWYHRALCYEKQGMFDDAYDSYRFLLTIDPGYFSSANNISRSNLTTNITPGMMYPPNGELPVTANPLFWILVGTGVGGLLISGLVIYHIRNMRKDLPEQVMMIKRTSSGPVSDEELCAIADQVMKVYHGDRNILIQVLKLAMEIAREGREGKPVGTAFILGDSDAVLERSRQLILNPFAGHLPEERLISNSDMRENVKELSLLDGAFVIRENGTVEAAGRYISIDTSNVKLSKGFGTRHVSVAAITQETKAIGIVVSESGGVIRIMSKGRIIFETC